MSKGREIQGNNEAKIKWLLIDIGNVLVLKDRSVSFSELLAKELNVDIELAQQINKAHYSVMDVQYIPEQDLVASLKQDLGYNAPKNIFSYFARAYEKQTSPNTELFDFLDETRALGVRTAVLSNTISIYQRAHRQLGVNEENGFEPILYSWEVEMLKPNKDIFELALKRLDAKPGEIIFIDDKLEHIHGAQQVGLGTVLFDDTPSAIAEIRKSVAK